MAVLQGAVYPAKMTAAADLAGSTVTLTVTAPDGTASTPTTTAAGVNATASVPATQIGTYLLVWAVTGALAGVVQDQFTVVAPQIDLVSLDDLRADLNLADTTHDVKLRRWLRAATHVVENVTGPIRAQPRTDVFDGDVHQIVLPVRWVSKITSLTETWGATNFTLTEQPLGASTDAYGYTWDRSTNTITRRSFGGTPASFPTGLRVVSCTYVAGLTTIPDDIQLAVTRLIGHWYRKNEPAFRGTQFGSQSSDDTFNMPGNYMVPNEVMELLEPWRRRPGIF